jgi:hypothetical protein
MVNRKPPTHCWKNYHMEGTKTSHHPTKRSPSGKAHQVRNCVKNK